METRKISVANQLRDVSILGFGCMRFPMKKGEVDLALSEEMVDYAYKQGVNYFDTAWPYHGGKSEIILGNFLQKYNRESFFLADKLPLWEIETLEDAKSIFQEQLRKTQTSYFDFYLIHAVNKERLEKTKKLEILSWLEELKAAGKILNIGFSFHDDLDNFKEWVDLYPWDFCQIQLNYMDIDHQQGMAGYDMLKNRNIPVIIMEPVKGGALAAFHPAVEKHLKEIEPKKSIASWAFRWVASLDNVKVILSGMSNFEQVQDNIQTFSDFKTLTHDEQQVINNVRNELISLTEVPCTGCNYCMPCPHGVNIPGNFTLFNTHRMYQNNDLARRTQLEFKTKDQDLNQCISCNDCIPLCPQNIPIPEELARLETYLHVNGLM